VVSVDLPGLRRPLSAGILEPLQKKLAEALFPPPEPRRFAEARLLAPHRLDRLSHGRETGLADVMVSSFGLLSVFETEAPSDPATNSFELIPGGRFIAAR
jgi:hypothetical protein